MKRFFLSLAALLCAVCLAAGAFAESADAPVENDILSYTLLEDGSGWEITGCKASAETVTIPAEHEGLPVVSVDGKAFLECENLKEFRTEENQALFYAEDGVLFTDAPEKTLVHFPNAYPKRAYQAPEDTMAVASWAFAGQRTLDFLHFREGLKSFGDHMLDSVSNQIAVYVPNSLKTIGENLLQNQMSNVPFYGNMNSAFVRYARKNNIPFGGIVNWRAKKQTVELAEPDMKEAEGLPAPENQIRISREEYWHGWDQPRVAFDFSGKQTGDNTELVLDLAEEWKDIISAADGADPAAGLYGIGFTEKETVLRGYDGEGKLTGTRVVNGDFIFALPGACSVGVTGGKGTTITAVPYQPVITASSGLLPLDPEAFHYLAEDNRVQFYVIPFSYAVVSFDFPDYVNCFSYSLFDAAWNEAEDSAHYAMLCLELRDPYLLGDAGKIAVNFDYQDVLYEDEGFICTAATRFKLKEKFGSDLAGVMESVKTVMSGTYYPADMKINRVSVRADGGYPSSFRSVITLDQFLTKFNRGNILTFAHEMTHAVDQTLEIDLPSTWMEGRAEYISRKVCDTLRAPYQKYRQKHNWSFLSDEDKADFFRYYTSSTNRETEYPVGYYFFKYLCDTYGEDVSAKIMQNLFDAAGKLSGYEYRMPNDVFKKCVTDATDPDVFQNFVRDVIEK